VILRYVYGKAWARFSKRNVEQMRGFYLGWLIFPTPSGKLETRAKCTTLSGGSSEAIFQTVSGISVNASNSLVRRFNSTLMEYYGMIEVGADK
jgi:hypothetical protein